MDNSELIGDNKKVREHNTVVYLLYSALVFVLLIINCQLSIAQTNDVNPNGYNKFYYPGGKLQSEGTMKEGVPEGYWKNYFEDGTLKSEGNRSNHTLEGDWKFYNEKGILTTEINYSKGKRNGIQRT